MNPVTSRFGTIRARIAAIAAIAVALVLTTVAVVLVALVRWELFANLDSSLEQRADTYQTTFLDSGDDVSVLFNSNDEDRAAQLVDFRGVVIATTPNLGSTPVVEIAGEDLMVQTISSRPIPALEDDAYRVLTRPIQAESGPAVLHVAQNIDDLNDTVRILTIGSFVAVPVIVALLAALVWWLVGRTLRPVELIRTEVADISGTDLQRRLPVPTQADEIARLASTMNELLDRIDNAGRRQRQFVADASHELRTPLTRIRTELEVDLHQPERADPAITSATVLEETIGLQQLLDDLLFLARSDENSHPARHRPTDLDAIVRNEVQQTRVQNPAVTFDASAVSTALVNGDADQLRRAVRNLLSNAARHASSIVTVALTQVDGLTKLSIADDGPGVAPEIREHIFERFSRADDARTRAEGGAGLGLAIVRDIIDRHRGSVRCSDGPEGGAQFTIELGPDQP